MPADATTAGMYYAAGALSGAPVLLAVVDPLTWRDANLQAVYGCMAVAGAALALAADTKNWPGWPAVATRCGCGAAVGFFFGPYLAERLALGGQASAQFAAGGAIGVTSWYLLKAVVALLPEEITKWVKRKFGNPSTEGGK